MAAPAAQQRRRDPEQKVQAAVSQLKKHHKKAKLLLKSHPYGKKKPRQKTIAAEAAKRRVSVDTIYKLRAFGDANRGYTDEELDTLCKLCERHGCALRFSLVPKLLTIHDKDERAKIQEEAIIEGWSVSRMKRELATRRGRRKTAGNRTKVDNLTELLAVLATKSIWWRRLAEMLTDRTEKQGESARVSLADIPDDIRKPFIEAVKWVKKLEDAVEKRLNASPQRQSQASSRTSISKEVAP